MNILQLLSSLNSDISIRAVAAHSKVLKDNNWNSYVYAPLGRELSYFKRWGSEIVSRRSSSLDIVYSKATIKEICNVVSSNSITILHVYDIAGYRKIHASRVRCKNDQCPFRLPETLRHTTADLERFHQNEDAATDETQKA